MKPLKAQLDELTDRQMVERCMELAGILWAYNETDFFEGRDAERDKIRRELRALRHDRRRSTLITAAIAATIVTWRGKPLVSDMEDFEDAEDSNDEAHEPERSQPLLQGPSSCAES